MGGGAREGGRWVGGGEAGEVEHAEEGEEGDEEEEEGGWVEEAAGDGGVIGGSSRSEKEVRDVGTPLLLRHIKEEE